MSIMSNQILMVSFIGFGIMMIFAIYMVWFIWKKSKPNKDQE